MTQAKEKLAEQPSCTQTERCVSVVTKTTEKGFFVPRKRIENDFHHPRIGRENMRLKSRTKTVNLHNKNIFAKKM
jgi:hypothetical protein